MLIPHAALVVVTDGATLALFRNAGNDAEPKLAALPAPELHPHSKDGGRRHHTSAANPDRHLVAEDAFVAAVADWLNRQALEGRIEAAVVVAPPRALGELRRHYHKAFKAKLAGEIAKELTCAAPGEIVHELKLAKQG